MTVNIRPTVHYLGSEPKTPISNLLLPCDLAVVFYCIHTIQLAMPFGLMPSELEVLCYVTGIQPPEAQPSSFQAQISDTFLGFLFLHLENTKPHCSNPSLFFANDPVTDRHVPPFLTPTYIY